jgi:hypothetical protein
MSPDMYGTHVSPRAFRRLAGAGAVAILVVMTGYGCRKAQANTIPQVPLDMPAPPPRVVEVSDPLSLPIVTLPEEPVRNTPPRPRPAPPQRTESRPADQKPEVPPDAPRTD